MQQIGDFWVWPDPDGHRLMLGNAAAAQEAELASKDRTAPAPIPDIAPPPDLPEFGRYALPGGPVVALHLDPWPGVSAFSRLLAPLETTAPVDTRLDYLHLGETDHAVWCDGALVAHGPEPDPTADPPEDGFTLVFQLLRHLFAHLDVLAVLHGAAVDWHDKRLVFMGRSGSGKSTLAALLVAHGGRYVSDDSVVLAEPGPVVHPVPMAPSIKSGTWPLLTDHFAQLADAPIDKSRGRALKYLSPAPFASGAGPVDLLIFPTYQPDADPKAVALTPIETLLHLSRAGLWLPPDRSGPFVDLVKRLPAIVLRHGNDFARTQALIAEHLP